jgi:hypothetical protein
MQFCKDDTLPADQEEHHFEVPHWKTTQEVHLFLGVTLEIRIKHKTTNHSTRLHSSPYPHTTGLVHQ